MRVLALCGVAIDQGKRKLADSRLMESPSQRWRKLERAVAEEDERMIGLSGAPAGYTEPTPQK